MNVKKAEELAKKWMPGFREGSGRKAWEHPQDLVNLLDKVPGLDDLTLNKAKQVAWLHDIIEDGWLPDVEQKVQAHMLAREGFSEEIVKAVLELTHYDTEDKMVYLSILKKCSDPLVALVKCADRICNLREGYHTFENDRWIRYVGESLYFIYPMVKVIQPKEAQLFLCREFVKATRIEPLSKRPQRSSSSSKCS